MVESLVNELQFKTSRSQGPGGQHVNKVESRVDLIFDVMQSEILSDEQKQRLLFKLKNRISNDGLFRLQCDETRSQIKNKEIVIGRFITLIENALKPEKKRKKTTPSRAAREKRLSEKRKQSEKKDLRKPLTE